MVGQLTHVGKHPKYLHKQEPVYPWKDYASYPAISYGWIGHPYSSATLGRLSPEALGDHTGCVQKRKGSQPLTSLNQKAIGLVYAPVSFLCGPRALLTSNQCTNSMYCLSAVSKLQTPFCLYPRLSLHGMYVELAVLFDGMLDAVLIPEDHGFIWFHQI